MRTAGAVNLKKHETVSNVAEGLAGFACFICSKWYAAILFVREESPVILKWFNLSALPGEVRPEAPESLELGCPEKLRAEVDPLPRQHGPTGVQLFHGSQHVQLRVLSGAQLPSGGCGYGIAVRQQGGLLPRAPALHPGLHRGPEAFGRDSAGGRLGGS